MAFFTQLADVGLWLAAVVVGLAPRRLWPRLEPTFPLRSAAVVSGILTLLLGVAIGVGGFFAYAGDLARSTNDWMLRQLALPSTGNDRAIGLLPYGVSALTFFSFLFFTPLGLLALYLMTSGLVRAASAWADDPRGDFVLSGIHWAATSLHVRNRRDRERIARERREGPETPDVLRSGQWAGLAGVDYVLLASRRKAEWDAGAIILTSTDWYRLGASFDRETPVGLRTVYPLTRLETAEVVRRGIEYELPRLK